MNALRAPPGEGTPLIPSAEPDPRRWGVLALVMLLSSSQVAGWSMWSPIAPAVTPLYGWDKDSFALLVGLPNVVFLVLCFFWASAASRIGLRSTLLLASTCMAVSTAIRLSAVSSGHGSSMALQIFSGAFNGGSAPPMQFMPPIIAQDWFPPGQRGLATACMTASFLIGGAVSNILGPWMVPEGIANPEGAVFRLLTVHMVWTTITFLGALFCPPKPCSAPSRSAEERSHAGSLQDLWEAIGSESTTVALLFGLPQGVFALLSSLLGVVLPELGFAEASTGQIGAFMAFGGIVPTFLAGALSDFLGGNLLKSIAGAIYFVALVSSACFARFAYEGSDAQLACVVTATLVGAACSASMPIFFEMVIEVTYPLSEEYTSALLVQAVALIQMVGYLCPFEKVGSRWLLWLLPGTLALCLLILAPFNVVYRRSTADRAARKTALDSDDA